MRGPPSRNPILTIERGSGRIWSGGADAPGRGRAGFDIDGLAARDRGSGGGAHHPRMASIRILTDAQSPPWVHAGVTALLIGWSSPVRGGGSISHSTVFPSGHVR